MKNLEQQSVSEDLLVTQSSNSVREYDLLMDIFSQVPVKSIGRFRCVSKSWGSIIRRPDFTELFLTKSNLTRPRILFVIEAENGEVSVFSSPQPQNNHHLGENYSLVATRRYNYLPKYVPSRMWGQICPPLRGFVFLHGEGKRRLQVICNPVTGESITLPREKATDIKSSFFGYDPINKQLKVLCLTYRSRYGRPNTHRILTLGTGKRVWRSTMECKPQPYYHTTGICINGVLYYEALFEEGYYVIVCFDFRFEKFSFIKMHEEMLRGTELMNYKGQLCAPCFRDFLDRVELWVLEDAGEHKWSKTICVLSPLCDISRIYSKVVGITGAGDIVFQPFGRLSDPWCLVFYNMERNTFTRVTIQGFQELIEKSPSFCNIFIDYVENVTLM